MATNILIVDDDAKNLDALEAILSHPEYCIVRAESGTAALRALLHNEFAVAILDVRMPIMDGFECARMIRANQRNATLPLIFVTGIATDMDFVFKGYSAGGVDYVIKPFEPAVIKAKVAVFVELFHARQLLREQIRHLQELSVRLHAELSKVQVPRLLQVPNDATEAEH